MTDKKSEYVIAPPLGEEEQPLVKQGTRLLSLDAYRGFIMIAMASSALNMREVASHFSEDDRVWSFLAFHFDHVAWVGCAFWDLIQPAFMFMVGVAMAYSYPKRTVQGHPPKRLLIHALIRSFALVAIGVFLASNGAPRTDFNFTNVLAQIGLGYPFLFLLWNRPWVIKLGVAAAILIGYWGLFVVYPAPEPDADLSAYGIEENWDRLEGFEAHWEKNTNAAARFDRWFLNLFPREKEFVFNTGGYQTLNFIPSLATMIFGLLAGGWIRSSYGPSSKFAGLALAGLVLLAVGYLLASQGVCPLVKRIWTPSWAIYSAGWATLMLSAFYLVFDVIGFRALAWPLAAVGVNSLAMYLMSQLSRPWLRQSLGTHLGARVFGLYGWLEKTYPGDHNAELRQALEKMVGSILALAVMWLICAWLKRQRIFIRL